MYKLERKNRATGKVWTAILVEQQDHYVLKAGAHISTIELKRCPVWVKQLRAQCNITKDGVLQQDVMFHSLDDAAAFVLLTNAIGDREWKYSIG